MRDMLERSAVVYGLVAVVLIVVSAVLVAMMGFAAWQSVLIGGAVGALLGLAGGMLLRADGKHRAG